MIIQKSRVDFWLQTGLLLNFSRQFMKRCFITCVFFVVTLQLDAQYYETVDTTNNVTLKLTLHNIIDSHERYPYTSDEIDTWDILKLADEDPSNPNNIWTIYRNSSYLCEGGGIQIYNREHTWPESYGFSEEELGVVIPPKNN